MISPKPIHCDGAPNDRVSDLSEQAARCRRLARSTNDPQASRILSDMAQEYAAEASRLKPAG
jgi:hypothetical protein